MAASRHCIHAWKRWHTGRQQGGFPEMRQIKLTYVALFVGLTLLWLLVDDFIMARYQFWPLRKVLVHYSGVLGIVAMSVAMVLAVRPRHFERFFDGLDKTYRLHNWLGISADRKSTRLNSSH